MKASIVNSADLQRLSSNSKTEDKKDTEDTGITIRSLGTQDINKCLPMSKTSGVYEKDMRFCRDGCEFF